MIEYEMSQATIENISSELQPFISPIRVSSWKELIRYRDRFSEGKRLGFGELRDPVDWSSLPEGKDLRIIFLVDELGPVIRWLLPEAPEVSKLLGGIYHDDLERGDGDGKARSGWLVVTKRSVRVSS